MEGLPGPACGTEAQYIKQTGALGAASISELLLFLKMATFHFFLATLIKMGRKAGEKEEEMREEVFFLFVLSFPPPTLPWRQLSGKTKRRDVT